MSKNTKALERALLDAGWKKAKVWWTPIGMAMEMCGHSGGYMAVGGVDADEDYSDEDYEPIGITFEDAMRNVAVIKQLIAMKPTPSRARARRRRK